MSNESYIHKEMFLTPSSRVINGECLDFMSGMDESSVDAIVTDPPYGLEFMGKEWDRLTLRDGHGNPVRSKADPTKTELGRQRGGGDPFIGKGIRYAAGKVAQDWHQAWAVECLRVLKPGGHLLAFGGTRTYHRLACAIEDAGFEIRDCLVWMYGQGFPKSLNLKDKWDGWGTALKPAHEPIVLARKPLTGTVAANVLAHGTGALNIDACRIGKGDDDRTEYGRGRVLPHNGGVAMGEWREVTPYEPHESGRWPANVLLDPEAAEMLDEQTGDLPAGVAFEPDGKQMGRSIYGATGTLGRTLGYGDIGGASRFFYVAKASSSERSAGLNDKNIHPTVKPVKLMQWLVRLVAPPSGVVLDPFVGSGATGIACVLEGFDFIGIERESEYVDIARRRISHWRLKTGEK